MYSDEQCRLNYANVKYNCIFSAVDMLVIIAIKILATDI
jgi:hypothetical protein